MIQTDPGSFRDPSGFVYRRDGTLLRQIRSNFAKEWTDLAGSGFLARLQAQRALVGHELVDVPTYAADSADAFAVLRPEVVDFISYPYEWSFGQLKDAALLTLDSGRPSAGDSASMRSRRSRAAHGSLFRMTTSSEGP